MVNGTLPGDATVILTGWCALVVSGGTIHAAKHCVRHALGVRRLSAVLFVAPDTCMKLEPLDGVKPVQYFSNSIMRVDIDVKYFKEAMGKHWHYREGNEDMVNGASATQEDDIEKLVSRLV